MFIYINSRVLDRTIESFTEFTNTEEVGNVLDNLFGGMEDVVDPALT